MPVKAKKLQIGRIPYLVCAPYFHLDLNQGQYSYFDGSPAKQNLALNSGKIHLSPTSSIEFARHPDRYTILPEICTAGTQRVGSVLLFSQYKWDELNQKKIFLTPDSGTSVVLLQILLKEMKISARFCDKIEKADAMLLIGDKALNQSVDSFPEVIDLGALWQKQYGLPFVFGLWTVNEQALRDNSSLKEQLKGYQHHLKKSIKTFGQYADQALDHWTKCFPVKISRSSQHQYFDSLNYHLGESQLDSLKLFYQLCFRYQFIESVPQIRLTSF